MKKRLLFLVMILLPMAASAHDIEVANADGITIYYNYTNDGKELEVTFRGSDYIYYSDRYTGNVVIPEEVTYMNRTRPVTSIGSYAFCQCFGLTSVTIGNNVTSIGDAAFYLCSELGSVIISPSVTSIGSYAFCQCYGLASIIIPDSVTSIGESAFEGCSGLTSISIPSSVANIDYNAFRYCYSLNSVIIGNGLVSIGNSSFYNCYRLTTVTISNSVVSIGESAFEGCSDLTSISIPGSVTNIGDRAFKGCSGLNSVTISNSVTSIGSNAFDGADIPTIISLIENPFKVEGKTSGYKTFTLNTFNNATLYVPKGTIDKYKATEGWKDFMFIEEGTGGGTTPQKCENPVISYENGKLIFSCATDGVEFVSEIVSDDIKKHYGNEISLTTTYTVSVYATKAGYENSDVVTKTITFSGNQAGDLNGDGEINITDVTYVIDIINQQ